MFAVNKFMKIHIVFIIQPCEILNTSDGNPFFLSSTRLETL